MRELVTKEVLIYSVGCEPAIDSYKFARSFMKAIADMTGTISCFLLFHFLLGAISILFLTTLQGGKYLSLAKADLLANIIIFGAREEINLEKYSEEISAEVEKVCFFFLCFI